jgi:hypothetical protein
MNDELKGRIKQLENDLKGNRKKKDFFFLKIFFIK